MFLHLHPHISITYPVLSLPVDVIKIVDAAFRNAEKTKSLEIWRIENKAPVNLREVRMVNFMLVIHIFACLLRMYSTRRTSFFKAYCMRHMHVYIFSVLCP